MHPNEIGAFVALLDQHAFGVDIAPVDPARHAFYFETLGQFSLEQIRQALKQLRLTFVFANFPKPADIYGAILKVDDGHPDAEIAWAMTQGFESENSTISWTAEIAASWGLALPLIHQGDRVAARMAFKANYERLVREARLDDRSPVWEASIGFDAKSRRLALVHAREAGQLTSLQVAKQIAGSTPPKGDALLALETSVDTAPNAAIAKAALAEMRKAIELRRATGESPDAIARRQTVEAKQRAAAMVEEVEFPKNLPPLPVPHRPEPRA